MLPFLCFNILTSKIMVCFVAGRPVPTTRTLNVRMRGCFLKAIITPERKEKREIIFFFFFFSLSETLISVLHLSTHLPSGNTVSSPFPNSSLMEKLGRKRSLKTFLGIEATRACCCTITQADPFENNF